MLPLKQYQFWHITSPVPSTQDDSQNTASPPVDDRFTGINPLPDQQLKQDSLERKPRMRRFHSYDPVDADIHFCVPRVKLVEDCLNHVIGEPGKDGHHFTI